MRVAFQIDPRNAIKVVEIDAGVFRYSAPLTLGHFNRSRQRYLTALLVIAEFGRGQVDRRLGSLVGTLLEVRHDVMLQFDPTVAGGVNHAECGSGGGPHAELDRRIGLGERATLVVGDFGCFQKDPVLAPQAGAGKVAGVRAQFDLNGA